MRIGLCVAALALSLFSASLGGAGPVQGGLNAKPKLKPGQKAAIPPLTFKGGERACVILIGDHDPVVNLAIYILDEKGKEVARDTDGGDFCVAIWYPPRDAKYTILLHNKGSVWNECYVSVK